LPGPLATVALLAVGVTGCATARPAPPAPVLPTLPATLTARLPGTLRTAGRADTSFGMDALGVLCRAQPGANLVLPRPAWLPLVVDTMTGEPLVLARVADPAIP
jgi:hypothetical protein